MILFSCVEPGFDLKATKVTVALTPPGFCLKSLPRKSGAGGGLAVLYRNSLTKNIAVYTRNFVFTAFEICEVRISLDSYTVVFLSVYRPPPS